MAETEVQILIKAIDEASSVLEKVKKNVEGSEKKIKTQTEKTTKAFNSQMDSLIAIGNAANAVDNIFSSYHNLQLRLENATERVTGAQDRLRNAQYNLSKVQRDTTSTSEDLAQAQREVDSATRAVTISQNNLARANNMALGTYISMGVQALSLIKSLPLLIKGIQGVTAASMAFVLTPIGAAITGIAVAIVAITSAVNANKKAMEEAAKATQDYQDALNQVFGRAKERPQILMETQIAEKKLQLAQLEQGLQAAKEGRGPKMPGGTYNKIQQLRDDIAILEEKYNIEYRLKADLESKKQALDKTSTDTILADAAKIQNDYLFKLEQNKKAHMTMVEKQNIAASDASKIMVAKIMGYLQQIPKNIYTYHNIVTVYSTSKSSGSTTKSTTTKTTKK